MTMSKSRSLFSYYWGCYCSRCSQARLIAGYPLVLEARLVFLRLRPTPLSGQRVQAICELLSLHPTDKRCQGKPVYASEFFATFRKRYVPGRWSSVNRGYVDNELGTYLTKCDAWYASASDGNFQSCYYDLKGDQADVRHIL